MREKIRVAIADDSALIYSDDYRFGWMRGFKGIDCETNIFDIGKLRNFQSRYSRYRTTYVGTGLPKQIATNIVAWKPHFVWCHHGRAASDPVFIETLRRNNIPVCVYLCDEPYEIGETIKYSPRFDYVFSMDLHTLEAHKKARDTAGRVFYLPPCADMTKFRYQSYLNAEGDLIRSHKAFFLGNADLIPRREWLEALERLVHDVDIRFFPHRQPKGKPVAKGSPRWIGVDQHPDLYCDCVVGLNVHRSPVITYECWEKRVANRKEPVPRGISLHRERPEQEGTGFWNDANLPASHVNPRFFEMAACGTCVVSDAHRTELARMFPMAPQAEDQTHFIELVIYYMNNLGEAAEIGRACSNLILRRHTYQHRAAEVLIRLGFKESRVGDLPTFLGEPQDWLNPQDLNAREIISSLERTGLLGRWSPQYGISLTRQSGDPNVATSIDVPSPW